MRTWLGLMGPLLVLGVVVMSAAYADEASFSADDVARGEQVYQAGCAACHGANLLGGPGGPALRGGAFQAKWSAQGAALLKYVHETMPPGASGSLGDADYRDVTAYLLNANGVMATAKPGDPAAAAAPAKAAPPPSEHARQPRPTQPLDRIAQETLIRRRAVLDRMRPVTDAMLRDPAEGDWLNWRRTYDGQGFSSLAQIDRRNVGGLRPAWAYQLAPGTNEITPLVHDGVMYVASSGRLEALDAATGDYLWHYARPGLNGLVRNLAIYDNLVYLAAETSVVALDMKTGAVVWDKLIAPADRGIRFGSGPIAAKGKIFQGMGYCVAKGQPGGCFIVALDARTGEEAWRFDTIARPGAPGGDTWNDTPLENRFGSSVWLAGSYDPGLDLLYFGTGQTYNIGALIRDGKRAPGLYTNSTLALRPDTGELVWHYQHVAGDVWDLDWAFERTLADLTVDGKPRRTVTTAGKLGIFDTLDAATGKYLFSIDSGVQTMVSGIDPVTGAKTIDPALVPEFDKSRRFCPSALGGRNWPATAYNPKTRVLYVPLNETCTDMFWRETHIGGPLSLVEPDRLVGRVQAIDLAGRRTRWTRRERAPQASAILATAGGLIFEGSRDRWFRASDDRTGKVLWRTRLDSAPSAFPITYSVGGVQYVAVAAGGGGSTDALVGQTTPEIVTPVGGTTLWVFRLPERN
ncbi:MAG TPA: PQQ-binding-like beta-propeller repeat protein [Novosphingobium sp.]|nr:PQQ-binding-like beta-propeller repeat protein [Novosphingobium sp.]